ncbi:MAG: DUF6285 domain-containing protein [Pseudomonadota bacterium]
MTRHPQSRRISSETLIQLAVDTLRSDIRPAVPAEQRYTLAMVANALEIARRDMVTDGDSALWDLLDAVYPDGDGTAERLAHDIRHGHVHDGAPPDLRALLKAILIGELRIRNPRFLKSREIGG